MVSAMAASGLVMQWGNDLNFVEYSSLTIRRDKSIIQQTIVSSTVFLYYGSYMLSILKSRDYEENDKVSYLVLL